MSALSAVATRPLPLQPTLQLSSDDTLRFRVDGWWHRTEGVIPDDEIPAITAIYDRLFAEQAGRAAGAHFALFGGGAGQGVVHQILGPEQYAPELLATRAWANARAVMTGLLGREPDWMSGHAICKPPHCPLATPWHQDEAYWGGSAYHMGISLWMPLQDVDARNGCMHFVPGSHLGDILPHRQAGGAALSQGLELQPGDWDLSNQVAVPLRAGGCTAHGGRMLHYTTANSSAAPRRAWIIMGGLHVPQRRIPAVQPWLAHMQAARASAVAEANAS
jgi:hypothetical protein